MKQEERKVLILGATGHTGGAAARELLKRGWQIRAVTRNPKSQKALALANLGAEVVQGDMDDRASLEAAFDGLTFVYSVQSWTLVGPEGEIRQGKLVADAARSAGVEYLVYGSAGTGEPGTGVAHFDSKLVVEAYMRKLGLPFTIIRPGPFMELLTEKEFYPAIGPWGTEPRVVGWDTPKPWAAVRDIGITIANFFDNPAAWLGRDITLFSDVKSLAECKAIFTAVDGKPPFRVPLPKWLFRKMAGDEFVHMWTWLAEWVAAHGRERLEEMAAVSREACPEPLDLESWLRQKRGGRPFERPGTVPTRQTAASETTSSRI